ncbi:MAG: hypothetical protein ACLQGV_00685 [Bryobacteraceae bacterium]
MALPGKIAKAGLVTFLFGMGLLIPASVGLLLSGVPTWLCPFPALTVIPAFWLYPHCKAAVLVPTLLFYVCNLGLFRGGKEVPRMSYIVLGAATILGIVGFALDGEFALKYHGAQYTYAVGAINFVWVASLWVMFIRNRKRTPSFRMNLLLNWTMFMWLSWYAFPWLGELP